MKVKRFTKKIAVLGLLSLLIFSFAVPMAMDVSAKTEIYIEGKGNIGGEPDSSSSPSSGSSKPGTPSPIPHTGSVSPVAAIFVCGGSLGLLFVFIAAKRKNQKNCYKTNNY